MAYYLLAFVVLALPSFGAEKTIIIADTLIKGDPWRAELLQAEYDVAINQALKEHKTLYPKSQIKVVKHFSKNIAEAYTMADKMDALGVVGFLYSSDAVEASYISSERSIPYLSPVSPLDHVSGSHSQSLAISHREWESRLQALAGKFPYPSIVIAPQTSLMTIVYAHFYQKVFQVAKTFKEDNEIIWEILVKELPQFKDTKVNVLFAGYSFEQSDVLSHLAKLPNADKRFNFIVHSQWLYATHQLTKIFKKNMDNFYVFSEAFSPLEIKNSGIDFVEPIELSRWLEFNKILKSHPKISGHSVAQPITYALKNLISKALLAAELSHTRHEFLKNIKDKNGNQRKAYLGQWQNGRFQPIKPL